jgi:hypothetical protein
LTLLLEESLRFLGNGLGSDPHKLSSPRRGLGSFRTPAGVV